ncbi:Sesquipedalian-1 [Varanus komodoensis]|uniref:sesquipedalian-1-like n=1 Tax=Varanus komodoensis TaxID=61221 RepID=UPI001CF7D98C|nr:sesquipedalian-1-like [Varanus komodoensis]XP_044303962.1 sesquipedalian-1-like [Varanus komodoensis]KAF7238848.1 Sesquipedalian-1 [Varanus komodoensis]
MKLHISSTFLSSYLSQPADRQGLLYKKSSRSASYQPCWCELRGNLLFYRERSGERGSLQLIILEGCTVELQESASKPYTFEIFYPDGLLGSQSYKMAAENQETMEGWVRALSTAGCGYLRALVDELESQFQMLKNQSGSKVEGDPRNLMANNEQPSSTLVGEERFASLSFPRLHQEFGKDIVGARHTWQEERRSTRQPEGNNLIDLQEG